MIAAVVGEAFTPKLQGDSPLQLSLIDGIGEAGAGTQVTIFGGVAGGILLLCRWVHLPGNSFIVVFIIIFLSSLLDSRHTV